MIAYVNGKLMYKTDGSCVVNISGLGYELSISHNTYISLPALGEDVMLYTYLQVREDGINLIGFGDAEEKELFLMLITVSGVGPKLALGVLSGMNITDLKIAIINEDVKAISSIKGVGKKTCERIALELKDKIDPLKVSAEKAKAGDGDMILPINAIEDAVEALVSLGVNRLQASKEARNVADTDDTAEDIITKVLKGIAR